MNWNNYNSNWKKLLGFRNMQEKLEKKISLLIFIYHLIFLAECMVCFKQRFTLDTWPYSQWAWDLCAPRWAIWAHPYLWGKFTRQSKLTKKTVKIDWKSKQKICWHIILMTFRGVFLGYAATRDAVLPLKK